MKHLRLFCWLLLAFGGGSALFTGCEPKEDIVTHDPGATLTASVDTVFFDTVFVSRGSTSRRFWVHNPNAKAVHVDEISLAGAASSVARFELIIDGRRGPARRDFDLRGHDSLLVLAKVTIDPNALDTAFLVTDDVLVRANGSARTVKLLAYGENARYYTAPAGFAERIACGEVWTAQKPIVLLGSALVYTMCTLVIEPGTRVYMGNGASLVVRGRLMCGALGAGVPGVTFRGLRRDDFYDIRDPRYQSPTIDQFTPKYAFTPGQWGAILFQPSRGPYQTTRNELFNTVIKNASYGVLIDNPRFVPGHRVRLESCVVRTAYVAGVWGVGAGTGTGGSVELINTVIAHCGERAVLGVGGGNWRLAHCTLEMGGAVFPRRDTEALAFNNGVKLESGAIHSEQTTLTVENSVLWSGLADDNGNLQNEILLLREGGNPDSLYTCYHNVLHTTNLRYNDAAVYNKPGEESNTNVFTADSLFRNTSSLGLNLQLDSLGSPARRLGVPLIPPVPLDLRGEARNPTNPSAGAYESKP